MTNSVAPLNRHGFKLAIICALPVEAESVRAVFDRCWEDEGIRYGKASGDKNSYTTGLIGRHNVVLVLLSGMGGVPAAQAAASLSSSFPKIELVLVVGICGVVPIHPETKEEILLGDVVLSTAVTQYDYGRLYPDRFEKKATVQDSLRKAPKEIQSFMNRLAMRQHRQKLSAAIMQSMSSKELQQNEPTAVYPGAGQDRLYEASYPHQYHSLMDPDERCDVCHFGPNLPCSCSCDEVGCDEQKIVARERHLSLLTTADQKLQHNGSRVVHFGRIGSANTVMKSGVDRDKLASMEGLVAFEMEGIGVWDEHPTIIIKGACDYADSHKNKRWQPYAAMAAAVCLKIVLAEWIEADKTIDHTQLLPSVPATMTESSRHRMNVGDTSFDSGGGGGVAQTKNHLKIGMKYSTSVNIDFGFKGPVGICLGQAPFIEPQLFIGRELEIEQMRGMLQPNDRLRQPRRLVLGGMGGAGKTQLALAYTNRHQDDYTSAFWLNASSQATVRADFQKVARYISGSSEIENLDGEQVVTDVHQWLSDQQNTRWLLIFDNYDDPSQYRLQQYYPFASHGTIIVTTRRPDQVVGQKIRLKSLHDVQEMLEILATRSGREDTIDDPYAVALAKRLAGLPLALASAGTYLQTSHLTFQKYLQEYEKWWNVDPYNSLDLLEYQDRTLFTTWSMSYARLEVERPPAAQLLRLLAYFDNQCIWYELLRAGAAGLLDWLRELVTSEMQFGSVLKTLTNYCFIEVQRSMRTWSMHNCIHDWTLAVLNHNVDLQLLEYAFTCVHSSISLDDWDELDRASYSSLATHAARLVHFHFLQDNLVEEKITYHLYRECHTIGWLLFRQVRLPEADLMLTRSLAGHEKALGAAHPDTLCLAHRLGNLYLERGKLVDAEQMLTRALAGHEDVLGVEHSDTLRSVHSLGKLYLEQGRLVDAEQMLTRALARREKALGVEHAESLRLIHSLGKLYLQQGRLAEAEQMYTRALAGCEKVLGAEHIDTLSSVYSLGNLYVEQRRLEEAEQMYLRALAGREKVLGAEHARTLYLVNILGNLYRKQRRPEEAEQMYTRALVGREKVLGAEHLDTLASVYNLGNIYLEQGRLDEAEKMFTQALFRQEKVLGADYLFTLDITWGLGMVSRGKGKLSEAGRMFTQVRVGYEKIFGPSHPKTLEINRLLEQFNKAQSRSDTLGRTSRDTSPNTVYEPTPVPDRTREDEATAQLATMDMVTEAGEDHDENRNRRRRRREKWPSRLSER